MLIIKGPGNRCPDICDLILQTRWPPEDKIKSEGGIPPRHSGASGKRVDERAVPLLQAESSKQKNAMTPRSREHGAISLCRISNYSLNQAPAKLPACPAAVSRSAIARTWSAAGAGIRVHAGTRHTGACDSRGT